MQFLKQAKTAEIRVFIGFQPFFCCPSLGAKITTTPHFGLDGGHDLNHYSVELFCLDFNRATIIRYLLKNPRKRIEAAAKFPYPYLSIIYQTSGACR